MHHEDAPRESKTAALERRYSGFEETTRNLLTKINALSRALDGCDGDAIKRLSPEIARAAGVREDVLLRLFNETAQAVKAVRDELRPAPARQGSLLDRAVIVAPTPRAGVLR